MNASATERPHASVLADVDASVHQHAIGWMNTATGENPGPLSRARFDSTERAPASFGKYGNATERAPASFRKHGNRNENLPASLCHSGDSEALSRALVRHSGNSDRRVPASFRHSSDSDARSRALVRHSGDSARRVPAPLRHSGDSEALSRALVRHSGDSDTRASALGLHRGDSDTRASAPGRHHRVTARIRAGTSIQTPTWLCVRAPVSPPFETMRRRSVLQVTLAPKANHSHSLLFAPAALIAQDLGHVFLPALIVDDGHVGLVTVFVCLFKP